MATYFSHDSNARNDEKILELRMKHGAEGYGIYWMLIERLREDEEYMSVKNYNVLAFDLRVDAGVVKSVIEDFGLFAFTEDGECFYSESLNRRMNMMEDTSAKRAAAGRKGAKKRWNKKEENGKSMANDSKAMAKNGKAMANAIKNDSNANGTAMANDGNKKKLNKNKIKQNKTKSTSTTEAGAEKNEGRPGEESAQKQKELAEIAELYQQNIGVLTPLIAEDLWKWADELGQELVLYALKLTVEQNANYAYAKSIMKRLADQGITTVDQARAQALQFKKKSNSSQRNRRTESIPDWMQQDRAQPMPKEETVSDNDLLDRLAKLREKQSVQQE